VRRFTHPAHHLILTARLAGGATRKPTGLRTLRSVRCGTVIGWRGRVYVSQVDDDVWIGGDMVTGVTGIVHE
jgi:hypothetical protein